MFSEVKSDDDIKLQRIVFVGIFLYIFVKVGFISIFAFDAQYLMDEFDTINQQRFLNGPYIDIQPSRTLLYVLFYSPARFLTETSVGEMRFARLETLGLAILALFLVYRLARQLDFSKAESALAVGMVLAFSSHMERAFSVRPEALFLVFALLGLIFCTGGPLTLRRVFVAGIFCGLAFVTAQKAVYYNVALGLALVLTAFAERSLKNAVVWGVVLVAGWLAVFSVYTVFFVLQGAELDVILRTIFHGESAKNAASGHKVYKDLSAYKWQSFARNLVPYLICLSGFVLTAWRYTSLDRKCKIVFAFSFVIVSIIYGYHSAPWPYNFMLAIPFLALWSPLVFRSAIVRWPNKAGFVVVVLAAVTFSTIPRNIHYLGHSNDLQEEIMGEAEALLAPDEPYFDGVYMLPKRRPLGTWMQASAVQQVRKEAETGPSPYLSRVFAQKPKIIILNYRLRNVSAALRIFLEDDYRRLSSNILIRKDAVALGTGEALEFPLDAEFVFEKAHSF